MNLFKKKSYVSVSKHIIPTDSTTNGPAIPDGMWVQCKHCKTTIYRKEMDAYEICPKCGHHFRLGWEARIAVTCDEGSFAQLDSNMTSKNPMEYNGYEKVVKRAQEKTNLKEGVVTGTCTIHGLKTVIAIQDSNFMMGSMGSVVGEKITRAVEYATNHRLPIIIFTVSGGARMQEGIISLMQMAKVSAAIKRHSEAGLFYITVLTDPTYGGVTASFAMLGDVILAEPGAMIGFAGQRVIRDTIKEELPKGFQCAQFQLEHGFVDAIVNRRAMKDTLARLLESAQPVNGQEQKTENTAALLGNGKSQENSTENTAAKATQKTAMEIVRAARDAHRPTTREFIDAIFTDFLELHGDRQFGDDGAIVGGIARFQGREVTVVGIQKGRNLDENIATNFGSPHPEGYRKALRLMKQAEKFGRPIVTFINTAGAYCGIGAEERGQGEAIAMNLMEMIAIKVPIICILIGEGGSGGALALGVGDQVWALENSMYAILSPEGFASILWRDPSRVEEAATRMKLTAPDLLKQHVIEEIIPEATDGIAQNPSYTMEAITKKLEGAFKNLCAVPTEELLENRYNRYRSFGEFEE
jgi:acetyl-CoA carboxylase carboxyl transferase subunit beta